MFLISAEKGAEGTSVAIAYRQGLVNLGDVYCFNWKQKRNATDESGDRTTRYQR